MSYQDTQKITKLYTSFNDFMRGEFETDELRDLAEHGADAGWPHITYTTDAAAIFDAYQDDIWEMLTEDAESYGSRNVAEFIGTFNRADMCDTPNGFKNLLVWYAAERYANDIENTDAEDGEE